MYCPFHAGGDVPCVCFLEEAADDELAMTHAAAVSFYPRSSMVRLHSRLYVFPYPVCKSLLVTASMSNRFGLTVFHRCVNHAKRNLYVVFQFVDANGFRYGIGYTLELVRAGRTVLAHLRCAQRAVRAFLGRRREARALAVAMAVPLSADLLQMCFC
jgi:hypothetical protein